MSRFGLLFGLFVCALPVSDAFAQDYKIARENGWTFDYDEARVTARKTNRPLMVVFRCVP